MGLYMQETLRLYPPVGAGQIRITHEPMSLGRGMPIPVGTLLWVPHLALHTAECNWDRAKEFVPGRQPSLQAASFNAVMCRYAV